MDTKIDINKRRWLALGGIMLGTSLLPQEVFAISPQSNIKLLKFYNINTREKLTFKIWDDDNFVKRELDKINYLFRDRRTGEITKMDPALFLKLYKILSILHATTKQVDVICGYRSEETNRIRRRQSKNIAKKSMHILGRAMDIRIPGISVNALYKAALQVGQGGTGYYPRSKFVHIDTGATRKWGGG